MNVNVRRSCGWLIAVLSGLFTSASLQAQSKAAQGEVTFSKDIVPILQRSCQECHRQNGAGPMSLITYEEVRPWARAINERTHRGPHGGVMPPWFVEQDIGIQKFKSDPSLTDTEKDKIMMWVNNGAPRGNPADAPPPLKFDDSDKWTIGEPDLVLKSKEVTVAAKAPDWWGDLGLVPSGLTEDRYVSAVEVREVNDIPKDGSLKTVGGRFVFHHMTYTSIVPGRRGDSNEAAPEGGGISWPIHEVGRNADLFPSEAGRLLAANSSLSLGAAHIHSNGRETKAHLEFGFKFFPKGYKPLYRPARIALGNSTDIDAKPNEQRQELHSYVTLTEHTKIITFEPHLHAAGVRMCLEASWGFTIQTLSCVGYDHNWVKQYVYDDDSAPLLPKGTIIHLIGFLDTSAANKNVADTRNWAGAGRRSVSNMFSDLGYAVSLTEEQFQAEMAKRRGKMKDPNVYDIGCPLCWAPPVPTAVTGGGGGQGN